MNLYLGIDIGSVTVKLALIDNAGRAVDSVYRRTQGRPVQAIQQGLAEMRARLPAKAAISGVGTTGSARYLAAAIVGGDVVKNEITSQAVATARAVPGARTIMEIGGQDSKLVLLEDGMVADFGMNTVCAAGTGSFLDHQAARLGIAIEDFGTRALRSRDPVRITGKCTVFAESDMIAKQQMGHRLEDILYGLCLALAGNYLSNVGLGREIRTPVVFQGGVAFNQGMVRAFKEVLGTAEIIVPPHPEAMGAIGAALLALEEMKPDSSVRPDRRGRAGKAGTAFKGFSVSDAEYAISPFECRACPNLCEIARVSLSGRVIASCGGRCDLWDRAPAGDHAGDPAGEPAEVRKETPASGRGRRGRRR
jgi:predicted CoA-substrate-specific enzyme activase